VSILSVCNLGPLLVGVERAGRMGSRTHRNVVVGWAARHRGHFVMVVGVIDRLGVGRVMRRIPDGVTVSLCFNFVTSKDYCALITNEKVSEKHGGVRTNHKE